MAGITFPAFARGRVGPGPAACRWAWFRGGEAQAAETRGTGARPPPGTVVEGGPVVKSPGDRATDVRWSGCPPGS
ncbi:hypothetical protein GCM10023108_20480 [Saccharopolyspora hordei]